MSKYIEIESKDTKHAYRVDWNDLYNSFSRNFQLGSSYSISFTLTYTDQFKDVFNAAKEKCGVKYEDIWYNIQQREPGMDENGFTTMKLTCTPSLVDMMKNIRLDPAEPTESSPDISGGDSGSSDDDKPQQPGTVVKQTDVQQTFTLDSCLHAFVDNNDQGLKYELHGTFPQAHVEATGSLYDWLGNNLKLFGAYWMPGGDNGYTLEIYDANSIKRVTGKQFRYMTNMTNVDVQTDVSDLVNDCWVYGGKMEKDITSYSGGSGAGGNLDNVEGFAKSPINADFGVNKQAMLNDFRNRDVRVRAWGVDVNKLYDTVKNAGVSPDWFMAYDLQEGNPTSYSWLNHFGNHLADPYQDAIRICAWIKEIANSNSFTPASGYGAYASPSLTAKWNAEFSKGTIGRVYLQGTAAAVMELANENPGRYGRPLAGCMNQIRAWGGHTNSGNAAGNDGGWGWPFPSVGEGTFMQAQRFGYDGGYRTNSFHDGLDFGSIDHPGSEVHAIHGGTCTISHAWGNGGINWYCVITDSTGLNVEYQEAFGSANNITVNVGQHVNTGDVIGYRTTNHLHIGITRHSFPEAFRHAFSNDGTWIDPLATIKTGIAKGGSSSSSSDSSPSLSTTSEDYYALCFHYQDQDSIKMYGLHRGPVITQDAIYDMNALKAYVENTVQHVPNASVTINGIDEVASVGDVWRLIAPELRLNVDVMVMGVEGNDSDFHPHADQTITLNNSGLAMKDVIAALHQDIKQINPVTQAVDVYGASGTQHENHFANQSNRKYTQAEMDAIQKFTDS